MKSKGERQKKLDFLGDIFPIRGGGRPPSRQTKFDTKFKKILSMPWYHFFNDFIWLTTNVVLEGEGERIFFKKSSSLSNLKQKFHPVPMNSSLGFPERLDNRITAEPTVHGIDT